MAEGQMFQSLPLKLCCRKINLYFNVWFPFPLHLLCFHVLSFRFRLALDVSGLCLLCVSAAHSHAAINLESLLRVKRWVMLCFCGLPGLPWPLIRSLCVRAWVRVCVRLKIRDLKCQEAKRPLLSVFKSYFFSLYYVSAMKKLPYKVMFPSSADSYSIPLCRYLALIDCWESCFIVNNTGRYFHL